MSMHWILNDSHEAVPVDLMEWAHFFEDFSNRRVRHTRVGPYFVSTVFLGLDHSFGSGPPLLFETMVYIPNKHTINLPAIAEIGLKGYSREVENEFLDIQERCSTWDEAIAQHESVMEQIRQSGDDQEEIPEAQSTAAWLNEHIKV